MAPDIYIICDITHEVHWLERLVSTKAPPADIIDVEKMFVQIQECADRMAAETLALVHEMRAQLIERPPQFGFHRPGLITPRRVDNADRSGANRFKIVNAVYGPQS